MKKKSQTKIQEGQGKEERHGRQGGDSGRACSVLHTQADKTRPSGTVKDSRKLEGAGDRKGTKTTWKRRKRDLQREGFRDLTIMGHLKPCHWCPQRNQILTKVFVNEKKRVKI